MSRRKNTGLRVKYVKGTLFDMGEDGYQRRPIWRGDI